VTSSNLVAQLNGNWRVVIVSDKNAWRRPAWMLQRLVDDTWRDHAAVRASGMLRDLVKAHVGRVDADAAKILAALPERVDLRVRESAIAAAPSIPDSRSRRPVSEAATKFLTWKNNQRAST
jgi:hypothetical protein